MGPALLRHNRLVSRIAPHVLMKTCPLTSVFDVGQESLHHMPIMQGQREVAVDVNQRSEQPDTVCSEQFFDLAQQLDGLLTVTGAKLVKFFFQKFNVFWVLALVNPFTAPGQRDDGFTAVAFH